MKNRLKTKEFSELMSKIKDKEKELFDRADHFRIDTFGLTSEYYTDGKTGASPLSEKQETCLEMMTWNRHKRPIKDKLPDIDGLFYFCKLASPYLTGEKELEAPIKLLFQSFKLDLFEAIGNTRGFSDEQMKYGKELFDRRNELPKENIFRKTIVTAYIDEEVYNRFYLEREKEAGRYETKEEGGEYTPEGAKEWDGHFNTLCDEYGEGEYKRFFDDAHYRKAWDCNLNNYPAVFLDEETETICREAEEFFKKEGIPNEEA